MKTILLLALAIDQSTWDQLLKRYVNEEARVDYARWKRDGTDSLDAYLSQVAAPWPADLTPQARKAALINAYNALTVRWILQNFPVPSIWHTPHPFTEPRHTVNGGKVSLDAIEGELRRMSDPRIHAALVCAARSCPPLRREAYTPEKLDEQLDANLEAWLANPKLNRIDRTHKTAEVSEIFKWYAGDFGSVEKFLGVEKLSYIPYYWGLNDSGDEGAHYNKLSFYWDYYRNK